MSLAVPPLAEQTAQLRGRLSALRNHVALWFWIDGLSRMLWLLLGLCGLDLAIDWMFRMDLPQRVVMLVLMAGAIAWLGWRRLARPLSATMSDDALALQVEKNHRELGQSLISALQLSQLDDVESRGMSPLLVRQTVAAGVERSGQIDFGDVLDQKEFRLSAVLLCLALAALAAVGVGTRFNEPLNIWFQRNILLGERTWPQKTYLVVERATKDGKVVFPRGEDWTQVVSVTPDSQVVPEQVYIDFRRARSRPAQAMKKTGERAFEAVFNNVIEPFEFRARGGDAVTPWVRVELVEQPAVSQLKLTVTPPKYTGAGPEELPPGKGPYYVLKGSTLAIEGTPNKPLVKAEVVIDGKHLPLKLSAGAPVTGQITATFSGQVKAADLVPGQYTILLEDTLGLTGRRPTSFGLRQRIDREPRVRVRLIGVSSMVVPKARIPFSLRATDDFAVTASHLEYDWKGDGAAIPDGMGKAEFQDLQDALNKPELAFEDVLELTPLDIPTGITLNFVYLAADNDDVSGPKTGAFPKFSLRVVTEEELRTDLLRREKEQRQEFERLAKNQEELLTDSRALLAGIKGTAALTPQQKDQLMQYQKRQKLIGQNTGAIAERLASIVVEVQNNRLEESGGKLQARLEQDIIQPMQEVAQKMVPEAMQLLDRTRRQAAEQVARDQALADAAAGQQQIVDKMQEILRHMVKSEGFQEAVNLLYEIQKAQTDVNEQTNKERQERIKKILEGAK